MSFTKLHPNLHNLAAERLAVKEWSRYIFLFNKIDRLQAFMDIQAQLSDAEYWPLLAEVWIDSENIHEHIANWIQLLHSPRRNRHLFMSDEDRAVYESLPSSLTIYRGYHPNLNCRGLCWTISRDIAKRLSSRIVLPGTDIKERSYSGKVRQRVIPKAEAFAYLNGREEQEIIFLGEYL